MKKDDSAGDGHAYVGTAEEIMRRLRSDPDWAAREARIDEEERSLEMNIMRSQQPLMAEFAAIGIDAEGVFDVEAEQVARSPRAAALVLAMLGREGIRKETREGLAHLLDFKAAKVHFGRVLEILCAESDALVVPPLVQVLSHGFNKRNYGAALMAIEAAQADAPIRQEIAVAVANSASLRVLRVNRTLVEALELARAVHAAAAKLGRI